jgi:glycosyltransferase involved in cell wall biosynthesis
MSHTQWLEAIVAGPETATWDPEAARAVGETLSRRSPSPAPADLLATPSTRGAAEVHLGGLEAALGKPGAVARERARFHAAWLFHLLEPEDSERLPLVSVVVPVYNAASLVGEAVDSALAQTWSQLEVVVVDDGSEDDPAGALADQLRGGRVRLVRQENRGAAGARNTGIAEARGIFVHFLDADDVLDTDSVERKLAALRAVPDAELCCSRYGAAATPGSGRSRRTKLGDELCPTRDLLATWVRRYPFQTSTVLVARWVLLETGPWDEDFSIPQSDTSDALYWFRLALRDTRVVALDSELGTRRFREGSLITHETALGPTLFLYALIELLDRPARWPYLGPLLVRMRGRDRWAWIDGSDHPRLATLREDLLERVRELGSGKRNSLSGRFPLLLLRGHVPAPDRGEECAYRERLAAEVDRALVASAEPSGEDLRIWLGESEAPPPPEENAPAVVALAAWLDACAGGGELPVPRGDLAALAERLGADARRRGLTLLSRAPTAWAGRLAWRAERARRRVLETLR